MSISMPMQITPAGSVQSTEPTIKPETVELANRIVEKFGFTIGGSYLVHGRYANDIDIFLTEQDYYLHLGPWLDQEGYLPDLNDAGAKLYEDDGGYALDGVLNVDQLQIILVKQRYVPAYERCAEIMKADPGQFTDKADRVALHRILRYLENIKE